VAVRQPILEAGARRRAAGATITLDNGRREDVRAPITIAADGRRSTLGFHLGLIRHPPNPRRWAAGAYFEGASDLSALGEMHIRAGYYIGVAPLPGGLANVCLVTEPGTGTRFDRLFGDPATLIETALREDHAIAGRFTRARLVAAPSVLGPLAVDRVGRGVDGLLLAGDAAGFVDPMTGDGLRFAVRDAELVAETALEILAKGWAGAHRRLAVRRARAFGMKRALNRSLRAVVGSPGAIGVTGSLAARFPGVIRKLVCVAGDTGEAWQLSRRCE
jgi:flavin-dependent dehydrogenase